MPDSHSSARLGLKFLTSGRALSRARGLQSAGVRLVMRKSVSAEP